MKALKILQNLCKTKNCEPSAELICSDEFQNAYSNYYVDKIRTALSFNYQLQDIENLFTFLKTIRKTSLKKTEFENKYNNFKRKNELEQTFGDFDQILKILFDNDMVCVNFDNRIYRWKYKETTIACYNYTLPIESFNDNTKIVFHWALEKSFSLYL